MTTSELRITGMSCGGCRRKVERVLSEVGGVSEATVDLAEKRASVTYDPAVTSVVELTSAVTRAGYGAEAVPVGISTDNG
jgi:copper chaperone CopZ